MRNLLSLKGNVFNLSLTAHNMRKKLQKVLIKFHFAVLIIVLLNTFFEILTIYSLDDHLESAMVIAVILSGSIHFFFCLRPLKKIALYFSVYVLLVILAVLTWAFRSFFFGVILIILLYPVFPGEIEYEQEGIIISVPFQGFMSRCCTYEVKERKLFIFEKSYGIIESGGAINTETIRISNTEDNITLTFSTRDNAEVKQKEIKK